MNNKKRYDLDEFIGVEVDNNETLADIVDKKIGLLRDFCILKGYGKKEKLVRELLSRCTNDLQMDILLHDVLVGNTTLDEMLGRYAQ